MAIKFAICETHSLKVVEISKHAQLSELLEAAQLFLQDPRHKQVSKFYVDLDRLEDARASFTDVYKLCGVYRRGLSERSQPISVALFAPTKLGLGISRMFSSIMAVSRVMDIKVFGTRDAAVEWLGLDEHIVTNALTGFNNSNETIPLDQGFRKLKRNAWQKKPLRSLLSSLLGY